MPYSRHTNLTPLVLSVMVISAAAGAQTSQQFLALPEISYLHQSPAVSGDTDADTRASLDLLYGLDVGHYRFFAELIATDEKRDLARLHLGYETRHGTSLLAGRFQVNQGYWNKAFHFRNYIQSSIQPPGIADFESEGGALPSHFSGINLSQQWTTPQGAVIQAEAGFGIGAKYEGGRLDAYDLGNPDGGRKTSFSLRLTCNRDENRDAGFGLFVAGNHIPLSAPGLRENRQTVAGAWINNHLATLRIHGALYGVNNAMETGSGRSRTRFYSTWLQGDYSLRRSLTSYLRLEQSEGARSDAYLELFPGFVHHRRLAGLRWDLLENHAVKIEYAHTGFLHSGSDQWAVQWSMILP